jgi:hypothetical protein
MVLVPHMDARINPNHAAGNYPFADKITGAKNIWTFSEQSLHYMGV